MSETTFELSPIEDLISEISKYLPLPHEDTIFGIAGRGHYENPTSDLLAYFMKPNAQHGFGCLFLREFFKCMNLPEQDDLFFNEVIIEREAGTEEGNRIDLLIETPNWILLIENKIYHHLANDLASYERLARMRGGNKKLYFAVISPYGAQSESKGWIHLTYKDYCAAIKPYLPDGEPNGSWSKWQMFAREFILHLETELYKISMTKEQSDFAEKNFGILHQTKKFVEDYRKHLLGSLCESIRSSLDSRHVDGTDAGWSLRFSSGVWNGANVSLLFDERQPKWSFYFRIYCGPLSEKQRQIADEEFGRNRQSRFWKEGNGRWLIWEMHQRHESVKDAEVQLVIFGGILDRIYSGT